VSWKTVALGDVCKVIAGQSPEGKYYNNDGVGLPFYQGKKDFGKVYINPPSVWTTEITKEAIKDDILMSVRAPVGPVNISRENICIGRGLAAIRSSDKIDKSYLFNYLLSIEKDLVGSSGAVFNSINKGQIEKLEIPLPPLSTQQKIVAKLDAIFAEIDKATTAAKANAKNAEALFQSYLNKVFEENSSNTKKIKDCCLIKPPKSEARTLGDNDEVSFMPMDTLGINQKFAIPNQVKRLSEVVGSYTYFAEGDVLLAKITPCFENGKLGIAKNLINRVGFGSSEYFVFRPNAEVDPNWLYFYLNRAEFRNAGAKHMSGAVGHKRVTKEFIEDTLLPLPSVFEQKKLVADIENLSAHSRSLYRSSQLKLSELEMLKQSILRQAFAGELVKE
jgi:type I restriction enzyme S subunit